MVKNKRLVNVIILSIFLLGIFFRVYQIIDRFEWGHDADLYSWIVKDILVDHHLRLIGQLTSAPGIYIGGLFYYLLVPFYALTQMNPLGALIPVTLLGAITVGLYYLVFAKLFNQTIGILALFLDATLLTIVGADRWVVPTVLTNIWSLGYLFVLIKIVRGDYRYLWLLGVLLGLVWHVHIALIPSLAAIIFAVILSKKFPTVQALSNFGLTLIVTNLPLVVFEYKHHFSQAFSLIENFTKDSGGGTGIDKLHLIFIKLSQVIVDFLFFPYSPAIDYKILAGAFLLFGLFLFKTKIISLKENVVLLAWFLGPVIFFSISTTIVSEYYLSNLNILYIVISSIWLSWVIKRWYWGKVLVVVVLLLILFKNLIYLISTEPYQNNYIQRKAVTEFITRDAKERGFPCVAVSYITPPGQNTGFRYLFYLNNLHVNSVVSGSPIYSIVIPYSWALNDLTFKSGVIGVISPKIIKSTSEINYSCSGQNSNLTDSLFGYSD